MVNDCSCSLNCNPGRHGREQRKNFTSKRFAFGFLESCSRLGLSDLEFQNEGACFGLGTRVGLLLVEVFFLRNQSPLHKFLLEMPAAESLTLGFKKG